MSLGLVDQHGQFKAGGVVGRVAPDDPGEKDALFHVQGAAVFEQGSFAQVHGETVNIHADADPGGEVDDLVHVAVDPVEDSGDIKAGVAQQGIGFERGPHPHVAVGQGEDGFVMRQVHRTEALFGEAPFGRRRDGEGHGGCFLGHGDIFQERVTSYSRALRGGNSATIPPSVRSARAPVQKSRTSAAPDRPSCAAV